MRASESSFESYKLTRILFFANFICSSLSEPKTKFVLTCSFQKMIRTLAFRGREKFDKKSALLLILFVITYTPIPYYCIGKILSNSTKQSVGKKN